MLWYEVPYLNLISGFLPYGATLINGQPQNVPVGFTDVDGDGVAEIIGYYEYNSKIYALCLKNYYGSWLKWMEYAVGSKDTYKNGLVNLPGMNVGYENGMNAVMLYPASINTVEGAKWGYINEKGRLAIEPIYDRADDFQDNGLAAVTRENRTGLIDSSGKYVVYPVYNEIDRFHEGRAIALDDQGYAVLDERGNVFFRNKNFVGNFEDGRAVFAVVTNNKWLYGYIDINGNTVIQPIYESAGNFNEGRAVVKQGDGKYALIDRKGSVLRTFNYAFVGDYAEGLMTFKQTDQGKFGYIDETGKIVIPAQFSMAMAFNDGRAVVNTAEDYSNKYGLIDRKGRFVIRPEYNDIKLIDEERAAVGIALDSSMPYKGSKYAIADINGNFLTDFIYYTVEEYEDGLSSVDDNVYTFFIDKTGKRAAGWPAVKGTGTLSLAGNLIKVNMDGRVSYIDKTGRSVWTPNREVPLRGGYILIEEKYRPNRYYVVHYPQINGIKPADVQKAVNERLRTTAKAEGISPDARMDYTYQGDFGIEFFKKDLLVLEIVGYNFPFGAAHGMPTQEYEHVDLRTGQFYQLKDLFKENSNYVAVLSEIIRKQIEQHGQEMGVWPDQYKGIKADQPFYVNAEALFIYFYPYEIAPYAAGFPTFKIPYSEIMNIIDTNGAFWKSYH